MSRSNRRRAHQHAQNVREKAWRETLTADQLEKRDTTLSTAATATVLGLATRGRERPPNSVVGAAMDVGRNDEDELVDCYDYDEQATEELSTHDGWDLSIDPGPPRIVQTVGRTALT
jgi:hypothetical protein